MTISVPKQEIGEAAVRRLIELIHNGNDVKYKIQICTTLVERDSVRDLNK